MHRSGSKRPFTSLSVSAQARRVRRLAEDVLPRFGLRANTPMRLLGHGENTTFRVDASRKRRFNLRIHRPSYQADREIQSELLWLDALANEKTRRVRQRLLRILSEMGTEVGELVVERFDDERWFVLRNLAMILGEVGDPSMVEQLSPMFEHADARVRQEAIASTIKLGGPHAAALLIGALDDEDATAYLMAIHGLGYHGNDDAVARIQELLKAPNFRGQSTDLVQTAAIALGRLSDEASRGLLTRLSRAPWFFRDRREAARDAAAWALAALDAKSTRNAPELRTLADLQPGVGSHRLRLRGRQTMGTG